MSGDLESLRIMEVLLTAEIFNQNPTLDLNDLTPVCREIFCSGDTKSIKRPVYVSDGLIKRTLDIADAHQKIAKNPFVSYRGLRAAYEDNNTQAGCGMVPCAGW